MSDLIWHVPDAALVPVAPVDTDPVALAPIDHVAAGLNRLPQEWRDKEHMIALFTIFLARYNDLEQAAQDLLLLRSIDTANADDPFGFTGAQLDQIGAKVGQPRNGLNNTDYRRYCRAKIATNNSNGLIEDIITITGLILNDPTAYTRVVTTTIATSMVTIFNVTIDDNLAGILVNFLRAAVAGGVRLLLTTTPVAPAATFSFSGGTGAGFGTSADADQPTLIPYGVTGATGGKLSNIRE